MALTLGVEGGVLEGTAAVEDEDARGEVDGKGGGARKGGIDAEADEGETTGSTGRLSVEVLWAASPVGRYRRQQPWVAAPPVPASPAARDW